MANRDKSQKVGFVYTNIYQLYKTAQNAPQAAPAAQAPAPAAAATQLKSDSRVWRAEELAGIKITSFQPPQLSRPEKVNPATAVPNGNPFDDLKSNMNRLQDLHSKLRFMLKELEDLVNKK